MSERADRLARVLRSFTTPELTRAIQVYNWQRRRGKPRDPEFEEAVKLAVFDRVMEDDLT